jgi:hypothetical protein
MTWLRKATALATALACCAAGQAAAQSSGSRIVTFTFTPTDRAQIAIWIEKPDGTFLATVGLTQAVSLHGIGNRPGATQMNSGPHWPYGRREGVLPIWAHRRSGAPDVPGQFPFVTFQSRPEGYASRTCEDSTPDAYFCLSFQASLEGKDNLDAISCASTFNSDKGRISGSTTEPAVINGVAVDRPLPSFSLYPPRRDFTVCSGASATCSGPRVCQDHPDAGTYADRARAAMPDIDAVTMATPPAGQPQTVMFSIPDNDPKWAGVDYVAWLEINTEGDYNGTYNATAFPTPMGSEWDSWAMTYGYPYRGQPSVVFSVPFTFGNTGTFATMTPAGYGSVDGIEPDADQLHTMDATITDDPVNSPGSGADRLLAPPGITSRLVVDVPQCEDHTPPGAPGALTAAPVTDVKHSDRWGHLHFTVPASNMSLAKYEVRTSTTKPIVAGDMDSFIQGLPALAPTVASQALSIPVGGAAGTDVDVDFGGLMPSTHYWVAVRAVDVCNQAGPHAVAELTTTRTNFTQLPPSACFVATAAWGSPLAPEVAALRRARDELKASSGLFSAASNLYWRSGPAAAELLARSDMARAVARRLIGPLGSIAVAEASR